MKYACARLKKQLVDDASVAAFAQLGSSFFAAARARLGDSRDAAQLQRFVFMTHSLYRILKIVIRLCILMRVCFVYA